MFNLLQFREYLIYLTRTIQMIPLYCTKHFDNIDKQNTSSGTHPDKTRAQRLCECAFAAVMRYCSVTAYLQCGINQLLGMLSPWSEVESIIQTKTGVMTRNFCL